jgi:single-stranded DNA-specific DHH superfamily exonuclease
MLTEKQIDEIREHLEKAQNPLFFFDNDNDGLTSFLLLQRFLGRGKGVVVKNSPDLNFSYYRKVDELKPDYIFVLDKPEVSQDFLDKAKEDHLPVVWIDHHNVKAPEDKDVYYYNSFFDDSGGDKGEPVSYLSYKITNQKKDMWIALIGCISDYYLPDFLKEFEKKYPDLVKKNPTSPFDLLYDSEIGRIARILDFSLKDTTTNVVSMMKFMMKVKEPIDILEENSKTKQILKRYNEINTKYQQLIEKARKEVGDKMIYFQYGGDMSLSYNLANQLKYEFPDKFIVVVYVNKDIANISIRGNNARDVTLKAIEGIAGATGGGHDQATGAQVNIDNLPEFKEKVEELVK